MTFKQPRDTRRTFDLAAMLEDRGLVNKRVTIKSIAAMIVLSWQKSRVVPRTQNIIIGRMSSLETELLFLLDCR